MEANTAQSPDNGGQDSSPVFVSLHTEGHVPMRMSLLGDTDKAIHVDDRGKGAKAAPPAGGVMGEAQILISKLDLVQRHRGAFKNFTGCYVYTSPGLTKAGPVENTPGGSNFYET